MSRSGSAIANKSGLGLAVMRDRFVIDGTDVAGEVYDRSI